VNRRRALSLIVAFAAGGVAAVWIPRLIGDIADRVIFPKHREEVQRINSPDGVVDAVVERIDCGVPCGLDYAVSVVRKGAPANEELVRQTVLADDAVNLHLHWREPHLLDVAYDRAHIVEFRNVTYPLAQPGNVESWRYQVEIHLSPSSSNFSFLKGTN
jgi:hypothetical protein